jgi:hypothetical protein
MFQVFCTTHGSRVLLDAKRIEGLHNTTRGPAMVWRCHCGEQGIALNGVSHTVKATAALSRPSTGTTAAPLATPRAA